MAKKAGKASKNGRYFFSVIEESVMNPEYRWGRGGRIEVYDSKDKRGYAMYEARWFVPVEFADAFREVFDFKYSDHLPVIRWEKLYPERKIRAGKPDSAHKV